MRPRHYLVSVTYGHQREDKCITINRRNVNLQNDLGWRRDNRWTISYFVRSKTNLIIIHFVIGRSKYTPLKFNELERMRWWKKKKKKSRFDRFISGVASLPLAFLMTKFVNFPKKKSFPLRLSPRPNPHRDHALRKREPYTVVTYPPSCDHFALININRKI